MKRGTAGGIAAGIALAVILFFVMALGIKRESAKLVPIGTKGILVLGTLPQIPACRDESDIGEMYARMKDSDAAGFADLVVAGRVRWVRSGAHVRVRSTGLDRPTARQVELDDGTRWWVDQKTIIPD